MAEKKKKKADKRRSAWVLRDGVQTDMRECFRSDAAMFTELGTNAKTGTKLLNLEGIKRDLMKDAVERFLDFLKDVHERNRALDTSKHAERDVNKAIAKYVDPKLADWKNLALDGDGPTEDEPDAA